MKTKGRRQSKNVEDKNQKIPRTNQDAAPAFKAARGPNSSVARSMENAAYQDARRLRMKARTRLGSVSGTKANFEKRIGQVLKKYSNKPKGMK